MDTTSKMDCTRNLGVNDLCSFPNKNNEADNNLRLLIKSSGRVNDINSFDINIYK